MVHFMISLLKLSLQGIAIILFIFLIRWGMEKLRVSHKYIVTLWMIAFFFLVFPWKLTVPHGIWNNLAVERKINESVEALGKENNTLKNATESTDKVTDKTTDAANDNEADQSTDNATNQETDKTLDEIVDLTNGGSVSGRAETVNNKLPEKTDSPERVEQSNESGETGGVSWSALLCIMWCLGAALLSTYSLFSYLRMKKQLAVCIPSGETGVFNAQDISVPMAFGVFKPNIYLPTGLDEKQIPYILAHERMHIRHRDPLRKMAAYLVCILHWFNPFVWLAFHAFSSDLEKACDEDTIELLGRESKKEYSEALLSISLAKNAVGKRIFVAPICFDEGDVTGRVKNLCVYKKMAKRMVIPVIFVCAIIFVGCLTKTEGEEPATQPDTTVDGETPSGTPEAATSPEITSTPEATPTQEPEPTKIATTTPTSELTLTPEPEMTGYYEYELLQGIQLFLSTDKNENSILRFNGDDAAFACEYDLSFGEPFIFDYGKENDFPRDWRFSFALPQQKREPVSPIAAEETYVVLYNVYYNPLEESKPLRVIPEADDILMNTSEDMSVRRAEDGHLQLELSFSNYTPTVYDYPAVMMPEGNDKVVIERELHITDTGLIYRRIGVKMDEKTLWLGMSWHEEGEEFERYSFIPDTNVQYGERATEIYSEWMASGQIIPAAPDCKIDFDGDGTEKNVIFRVNRYRVGAESVLLTVNGKDISLEDPEHLLWHVDPTPYLISMDGKTVQIAIRTWENVDFQYVIYAYEDGTLHYVGRMPETI